MRTMSRCTVYAKEFLSQINTRDPTRSEELFPKKLWNRNRNRCVENLCVRVSVCGDDVPPARRRRPGGKRV